jgi:dihydroorotate dehydrogenase (fumarate)
MMVNLNANYLGFQLKSPLVAAASPLSHKVDTVRALEDAGAGAVVMYSLFEEQILHENDVIDNYLNRTSELSDEAQSYFEPASLKAGGEAYLEQIQKLKKAVDLPIIASLNGVSSGGWINYAKKIEQAGADALELNIYYVPTETDMPGTELEDAYVDLVTDVRKEIHIPLAVKLSPFFTSMPNITHKLVKAGANSLVLFNRFYQPDLDVEALEVVSHLVLSTSEEMRLPLRWTAILRGNLNADLALTSGVRTSADMIKAVMAGANVVMLASELLAKGPERAKEMLTEMENWMEEYEYASVQQMCGCMSQKSVANPAAYERANYMKMLMSYNPKMI